MTEGLPPEGWGVMPVLFQAGPLVVRSYDFFALLGLLTATIWFLYAGSRDRVAGDRAPLLFAAALAGGVIGARVPALFQGIVEEPLLSGRTVIGGLIGGTLAVIWARRKMGIRRPVGNLFAPGLALGLGFGRIGCFLNGCCYGAPCSGPLGVNLGDGITRHPVQLYEAGFLFGMFIWLVILWRQNPPPGSLFRKMMISIFSFRFLVEFLRAGATVALGLTLAQLASAAVVAVYLLLPARRQVHEELIAGRA